MRELWYRLQNLPDLGLNKYASLNGSGVNGVLERHLAFLRQWNRKGILSGISLHLFYLYICPEHVHNDRPGKRLEILLLVRGEKSAMENVPGMMSASPLSQFYTFSELAGLEAVFVDWEIEPPAFQVCSLLTKSETFLRPGESEGDDYYMIREWEMNENGRLYNMCKLMEALHQTALFRVDLYPVERSQALRESFRKPVSILRRRQEDRYIGNQRDYEGRNVLNRYEQIMEQFESTPHFIANVMVFASRREDAEAILDAAGSEALTKGKYSVATFAVASGFQATSFLGQGPASLDSLRDNSVLRTGRVGLIVCKKESEHLNLNYLPSLFALEEISPFFRFPALYEGEVIQKPKETAPPLVPGKGALLLGKDENGYDVHFPLELLSKHAFLSGVPGSGKTNTMHHIVSSLWKDHDIPFLILEPAKQEYRALVNDPGMAGVYIFSPNSDMSFPLHINPFEMPRGTLVAEHIRRLCSVFEGAFPLFNPMPFLLDTAIEAVYRELGWIPEHVYTGEEKAADGVKRKRLPTMSMLYQRLEEELKSTRYSGEIQGNLESALKVRIGSLLRREMGEVFDVAESTFPPEKWLSIPAIIELESMGSGPANFLTLMLCTLIRESLKANPRYDGKVRHVLFIEEAHNLIGPEAEENPLADANPKQAATAFLVQMLAEVRALKEAIVIADQLPTVMAQEVLKNTGLKIGLRITSVNDRSTLGGTMAASELQMEQMATFDPGEALIFYEGLMRPFRMRITEWDGHSEDKTAKAELVHPRNDAELRNWLASRDTYREANMASIHIIGKKYYLRFQQLSTAINLEMTRLRQLRTEIKELETRIRRLCETQDGVTDQENELYDILNSKCIEYDQEIGKKKKVQFIFDSMVEAMGWIYALERLKQGRWKRFGIPDSKREEICVLQQLIALAITDISDEIRIILKEYSSGDPFKSILGKIDDFTRSLAVFGAKPSDTPGRKSIKGGTASGKI